MGEEEHPHEVLLLKVRAGQLLEQLLKRGSSNLGETVSSLGGMFYFSKYLL